MATHVDKRSFVLKSCLEKFNLFVKHPENFLNVNEVGFQNVKILTKVLYDFTKDLENTCTNSVQKSNNSKQVKEKHSVLFSNNEHITKTLPKLFIDEFNEEQVWSSIELQNEAVFPEFVSEINGFLNQNNEKNYNSSNSLEGKRKKDSIGDDSDLDNAHVERKKKQKTVHFEGGTREDHIFSEDESDNDIEYDQEEDGVDSDISEFTQIEDSSNTKSYQESIGEGEKLDPEALDPVFDHMSDSDLDDLPLFESVKSENLSDLDSDTDGDKSGNENVEDSNEEIKSSKAVKSKSSSRYDPMALLKQREGQGSTKSPSNEVDDAFFKLNEMEKFLELEDEREAKRRASLKVKKGIEEESSDEEENYINLFQQLDEFGDNERIMYKDFFKHDGNDLNKPVSDALNELNDEDEDSSHEVAQNDGTLEEDETFSSSDEIQEPTEKGNKIKSTHEKRQERVLAKIQKLENDALSDKTWQLTGEAAAVQRPENSLLGEHLEFDKVVRPAPMITQEISERLEDIIKRRIKDQAWDDVERKVKPVEDVAEYKKKLVLNQEKSKASLAEIYEEEYLKQTEKSKPRAETVEEEEVDPEEVEKIKKSMSELFSKLDSLSNFHYNPRLKVSEVKIIRNVPAITMEEVAPVNVATGALLTAEEVVNKQRETKGQSEKESTDKKRERRRKKLAKKSRLKNKAASQAGAKLPSKSTKSSVTKKKEKSLTSTDFFNKLQDEAVSRIDAKKNTKDKLKARKQKSVSSFKL